MGSHTILYVDMPVLFALSAFVTMAIILQVFLSKTENKWSGAVMPIIMFGISLTASFQFATRIFNTRSFTGMINGEFIEHTTSMSSIIAQTVLIFVVCNIATGILIAVSVISGRQRNRQRALEMMSVQDLG